MNIIEAIKSGRPFRRSVWGTVGQEKAWIKRPADAMYGTNDVLAEDWEVQEPSVTLTWSEYWLAIKAADEAGPLDAYRLAKLLGLER